MDYGLTADVEQIDLASSGDLPAGYEAGHAIGYRYEIDNLPSDEQLRSELIGLLGIYRRLILDLDFGDDDLPKPFHHGQKPQTPEEIIIERRRYSLHSRIERRRDVSAKVKKIQGLSCRACDFHFGNHYGSLGEDFIEVHHLKPLASLELDVHVSYSLKDDYAVLCANCHRMIHRLADPSDLLIPA